MFLMGKDMLRILPVLVALLMSSPAIAQALPDSEEERRALILSVRDATGLHQLEGWQRWRFQSDIYRSMIAAGVSLTPEEAYAYGDIARKRGQPIEGIGVWGSLVERGVFVEASKVSEERAQSLFDQAVQQAEKDRLTGIQQSVSDVSSRWASDDARLSTAEALISVGKHQHAIDMLRGVLARKKLEEPDLASARLSLCRALIAAGRLDEARWELANFEPALPGYDVLVRVWLTKASETR